MKKHLLLLCAAFSVLSCNDDSDLPSAEEKLIPTKILIEDFSDNAYLKDSILYEYDNLNKPIKITRFTTSIWYGAPNEHNKDRNVATIEYNNKDVTIRQISFYTDPSKDLTLDAIQELKLETSNSGTIYIKSRHSLSENYKDVGTVKFTIDNKDRFVTYGEDKYWYDDKGNIVRDLFLYNYEKVFKYENKNGVFKDVDIPPYMKEFLYWLPPEMFAPQDVVEGNAINENYVNKYENEYNENNYPKKKVCTTSYKTGNYEPEVREWNIEYKRK